MGVWSGRITFRIIGGDSGHLVIFLRLHIMFRFNTISSLFILCNLILWSSPVQGQCLPVPPFPVQNCTQTVSNGPVSLNNVSDVICLTGSGNIGTVNFNAAGTLIIEAGATFSGGISANNGGTLIVKGTFDWTGAQNLASGFDIYIDSTGQLNKSGDLTLNNSTNQLVNLGSLDIASNLTFVGDLFNAGTLTAQGININSTNSRLSNSGSLSSAGFLNVNGGAYAENCGDLEVGVNLEINSGATFINYCDLVVHDFVQQLSAFENYGVFIAGTSGSGDGFLHQGNTTLHGGSVIVTKDFFWSSSGPIELTGDASIVVASSVLNAQNEVTALNAPGRLRVASGASLSGTGTLDVCDIDPISTGDNPTAPNVTFPAGVAALINVGGSAALNLRACDPQADIPESCDGDTTIVVIDPCDTTNLQIAFTTIDVDCNGDSTGSISASVSGGTAPYQYVWSTGDSSVSIGDLPAGNYTLCVFDANGCTAKRSVDIAEPAPVGVTVVVTDADCGLLGEAQANAVGGTPPYSYLWSNGATTSLATGLFPGMYTVQVVDANGCLASADANIGRSFGPQAALDCCADTAICAGSNVDLPVDLSGPGPWDLTYAVNGVPVTVTATQSPYIISLSPTAVTTVELLGVATANCSSPGEACGFTTIGVNNCSPCNNPCPDNCFYTELVNSTVNGSCQTMTLRVSCDGTCRRALSNMTISIPCGSFQGGSTTAGFPVIATNPNGDPNSGLHGIKVDNINNFCENGGIDTFEVTYTVCFDADDCGTSICDPLVAFKAGTCVFYGDADAHSSANLLQLRTYPSPGNGPLFIQLEVMEEVQVQAEVVSALGGQIVFEEDFGVQRAGAVKTYSWDGIGCGGQQVLPGLYLLRIKAGDEEISTKIIRE